MILRRRKRTYAPQPDTLDVERLAAFLFRVARDELSFGRIEEHVRVVEAAHGPGEPVVYVDEASPMGEWAIRTARRLMHLPPGGPEEGMRTKGSWVG
jgi:hypothetical protein